MRFFGLEKLFGRNKKKQEPKNRSKTHLENWATIKGKGKGKYQPKQRQQQKPNYKGKRRHAQDMRVVNGAFTGYRSAASFPRRRGRLLHPSDMPHHGINVAKRKKRNKTARKSRRINRLRAR